MKVGHTSNATCDYKDCPCFMLLSCYRVKAIVVKAIVLGVLSFRMIIVYYYELFSLPSY